MALEKYGLAVFSETKEVRHLNNDKLNNLHDNIRIGTHSQNLFDTPLEDRRKKAETGAAKVRKLTPDLVLSLRKDHQQGMRYKALRAKYGLAKSTIHYIIKRVTYSTW